MYGEHHLQDRIKTKTNMQRRNINYDGHRRYFMPILLSRGGTYISPFVSVLFIYLETMLQMVGVASIDAKGV